MAEKFMAQALTLMRAFYQPGDIRYFKMPVRVIFDDAKDRLFGRERVRGDLGFGLGDKRYQGRFSGVRETEKPAIRDKLQFELQYLLFAGFAFCRWFLRGVASPAEAAFCDNKTLAGCGQVP